MARTSPFCANVVVGYALGSWGLVGVGAFFLVSSFFLIGRNDKYDVRKIVRIALQTFFWYAVITLVSCARGIKPWEITYVSKELGKAIVVPFIGTYWYITAYIFMYLVYPFMNRIIEKLDLSHYRKLLIVWTLLLFIYTSVTNITLVYSDFNLAVYYYFLGGYLKRKPGNWFERNAGKAFFGSLLITFTLEVAGNLASTYQGWTFGNTIIERVLSRPYILSVTAAVSLFYLFKNMKMRNSKFINFLAEGSLGVYLIHENPIVFSYVWWSAFHLNTYFDSNKYAAAYVLSVLFIYGVSTMLDLVRLYCIEVPLNRVRIPALEHFFDRWNHWVVPKEE